MGINEVNSLDELRELGKGESLRVTMVPYLLERLMAVYRIDDERVEFIRYIESGPRRGPVVIVGISYPLENLIFLRGIPQLSFVRAGIEHYRSNQEHYKDMESILAS